MIGRIQLVLTLLFLTAAFSQGSSLKRQKRIVGGRAAALPDEEDPIVYVSKDNRNARIRGTTDSNREFYAFRGIRFAEPPMNQHRFQRPIPVHLEGKINATKWAPPCPQPDPSNSEKIVGSEDCLFLNVFTPIQPAESAEGHPVLLWIHGGGFRRGSACQYEMKHLIKKGVIVVSLQYRLGSLGFLSSGTKQLPGNNGMFDMLLAANWVNRYIEFFGGNPNNTVIFGHGSGASAAMMLSVCKFSRSMFSGIIAMSGSFLSNFAMDKHPLDTAKEVAIRNNCPVNDVLEMTRCLQQLPVANLIEADSKLELFRMGVQGFVSSLSSLLSAGPVVEGSDDDRSLPNFMTEAPEDLLKLGNFPSIPLLTGVVKDELAGAIFGGYREEVESKLKTIPNFVNEHLVPSLQKTIPGFENTKHFVSDAFGKYLNVFKNGKSQNKIGKIAEIMGDSLYNVPAFLTLSQWSKKAETFLYSFDYPPKRHEGRSFLQGSPIANSTSYPDGVTCHGDDLGFVFGRNALTGEILNSSNNEGTNSDDQNIMEVFTTMITDFVKNNGRPSILSRLANNSQISESIPKFSSVKNTFVSVTTRSRVMDNFRYCEMGLWTGLAERLKSSACGLLSNSLSAVESGVEKSVDVIGKPTKTVGNVLPGFAFSDDTASTLQPKKNPTAMSKVVDTIRNKPIQKSKVFPGRRYRV